jgi:tRNA pseudouridine32 synthase/23S rRNA pseudouridine746 synthase
VTGTTTNQHPQPALRIVLQTGRFVVVDKPPGVRSVPGLGETGDVCVINACRTMFPDATGPLSVHRLDMPTSGLMVIALDPESHRKLSWQFESRTVRKRYRALVVGHVPASLGTEQGEVTLPLRADITRRPTQIVDFIHGRNARTLWRSLAIETRDGLVVTRVEFEPVTGRSHQIRVHAASPAPGGLGAPILGDALYGTLPTSPDDRLMLHASKLEFDNPGTGDRISVDSPSPF